MITDISDRLNKCHEAARPSEFESRELHDHSRSMEARVGERSTGDDAQMLQQVFSHYAS